MMGFGAKKYPLRRPNSAVLDKEKTTIQVAPDY
jgi:hypothetical protein